MDKMDKNELTWEDVRMIFEDVNIAQLILGGYPRKEVYELALKRFLEGK